MFRSTEEIVVVLIRQLVVPSHSTKYTCNKYRDEKFKIKKKLFYLFSNVCIYDTQQVSETSSSFLYIYFIILYILT